MFETTRFTHESHHAFQAHYRSEASAMPCVYVVDDDISVRESLEMLLEASGWQVLAFECAEDFLGYTRGATPSCLILDISLPGINGLDLQERLADELATTPVVFVSGGADVPMTVRAMRAGAIEVLTKPLREEPLLAAIDRAIEMSRDLLRREGEVAAIRDLHARLTPRETEVMALVVAGRLNKQVAAELGISEITVKAHRGCMMRKMKARSLADLVRMAGRLEVSPDAVNATSCAAWHRQSKPESRA